MKEKINEFWSISYDQSGIWLWHCGKPVVQMDLETAQAFADQIKAWEVGNAYSTIDEDGNIVPDEVLMSAI